MNVKVNGTYVFLNTPLMTIDVFLYGWQNGNNRPAEKKHQSFNSTFPKCNYIYNS